ncbi:MAG: hypothetical protein JNM69_26745 [Archangium sp.]|nr:hypothetical protein [Archangium sp.]
MAGPTQSRRLRSGDWSISSHHRSAQAARSAGETAAAAATNGFPHAVMPYARAFSSVHTSSHRSGVSSKKPFVSHACVSGRLGLFAYARPYLSSANLSTFHRGC